jgi:hypothetical protein
VTLPNLASSAVNFSGTAVTTATFTRPTATGGTLAGDLLIGILNTEVTGAGALAAFAAVFPGPIGQNYADGTHYVGYRRAAGGDPATWPITIQSSAYQAIVLAYRNVMWVQDRRAKVNASSLTITGIADLLVAGPNFDVLPIHIVSMDQEAARTLTPGAGHINAFDSTEATTFLRTTVLHGVERDTDADPLPAINSSLSVAEAHSIVAFSLAGVAIAGNSMAEGSTVIDAVAEPFPISDHEDTVADSLPVGGGGAAVPTTGQLWPRGA